MPENKDRVKQAEVKAYPSAKTVLYAVNLKARGDKTVFVRTRREQRILQQTEKLLQAGKSAKGSGSSRKREMV